MVAAGGVLMALAHTALRHPSPTPAARNLGFNRWLAAIVALSLVWSALWGS